MVEYLRVFRHVGFFCFRRPSWPVLACDGNSIGCDVSNQPQQELAEEGKRACTTLRSQARWHVAKRVKTHSFWRN